jgi:hypothetical protein
MSLSRFDEFAIKQQAESREARAERRRKEREARVRQADKEDWIQKIREEAGAGAAVVAVVVAEAADLAKEKAKSASDLQAGAGADAADAADAATDLKAGAGAEVGTGPKAESDVDVDVDVVGEEGATTEQIDTRLFMLRRDSPPVLFGSMKKLDINEFFTARWGPYWKDRLGRTFEVFNLIQKGSYVYAHANYSGPPWSMFERAVRVFGAETARYGEKPSRDARLVHDYLCNIVMKVPADVRINMAA